ncbi:MAG: RNA methyltransferase [Desulfurococcales archaeon]|nr:RNA methyltransferase [Desulfurococcales archaeon]
MNYIRLVLVEPEGRINFGFILRLARNFNVSDICLVKPKFDLRDPEILEFAAGGVQALENCRICSELEECLKGIDISVCTTSKLGSEKDVLRQGVSVTALRYILPAAGGVALVFGRESVGLTREELSKCDIISTITLRSDYNVMNLSHAIAIYLYELSRRKSLEEEGLTIGIKCDKNTYRAIIRLTKEIASLLSDEEAQTALKHMLARAMLTKPECSSLYKFFKKILHELRTRRSGEST